MRGRKEDRILKLIGQRIGLFTVLGIDYEKNNNYRMDVKYTCGCSAKIWDSHLVDRSDNCSACHPKVRNFSLGGKSVKYSKLYSRYRDIHRGNKSEFTSFDIFLAYLQDLLGDRFSYDMRLSFRKKDSSKVHGPSNTIVRILAPDSNKVLGCYATPRNNNADVCGEETQICL